MIMIIWSKKMKWWWCDKKIINSNDVINMNINDNNENEMIMVIIEVILNINNDN